MVAMAPVKSSLRCQNQECRKVIMDVTGLQEVKDSGIAITRRCKCGTWNEWKVLPDLPRVQRYCKTT
jgi:hypothetical protein